MVNTVPPGREKEIKASGGRLTKPEAGPERAFYFDFLVSMITQRWVRR